MTQRKTTPEEINLSDLDVSGVEEPLKQRKLDELTFAAQIAKIHSINMSARINEILKYYRQVKMNNKPNPEFKINPYKGFGNKPYILLNKQCPPRSLKNVYNITDSCYWFQDPESGDTDFLYHSPKLEKIGTDSETLLDIYQTKSQTDGYAGRVFRLCVNYPAYSPTPILVDLRGAWSGGCYLANKFLPKPATEVTYWEGGFSYIAAYLTLEKVNELLKKYESRWSCRLTNHLNTGVAPEFLYAEGYEESPYESRNYWTFKPKEEWSPQTLNALDLVWKTPWPGEGQPRVTQKVRAGL